MSWIEEQTCFGLEEAILDDIETQQYILNRFLKQRIWTTKDGREIALSRMTTMHIRYSINKCKRENWRLWALPGLEKELARRIKKQKYENVQIC